MIDFPVSFASKEVMPWCVMSFLKLFLDKIQFSNLVRNCSSLPVSGSNRSYAPEVILRSFIASIWCGANRLMHTEFTRLDPAFTRIFGWKQMPARDAFKPEQTLLTLKGFDILHPGLRPGVKYWKNSKFWHVFVAKQNKNHDKTLSRF